MGYDTELTFKKLEHACILLGRGVDFVATNPDWVCPTSYGCVPDCGSVCEMLYRATRRRPLFIGKPQGTMAELAVMKSGFDKSEAVLVGDRLYTDIACGENAKITTVFVLSGEGTEADISESSVKPDYVMPGIGDLLKVIRGIDLDFSKLLAGTDCACGRRHSCGIENIIIESGAVERLDGILGSGGGVLLVCDENTDAAAGEAVRRQIGGRLDDSLVYPGGSVLVPDEAAILKLQSKVTENVKCIVGVGSGVISDLCKYVSFNAGLPYIIVATAPSMDGYASSGAAMITGNMKVTYSAHVPYAIIGDIDILKNAPLVLLVSGYGDIIGKFSCLCDWRLANVVTGEYFCPYIYSLTAEMLERTKNIGAALLRREPEAVKTLTEALVGVGIAMAYAGNSRPASGSEHHLSHFFELVGIMKKEPYLRHGTDVIYSTCLTQRLRERLLTLPAPVCRPAPAPEEREAFIREIYGDAADGIIKLQNNSGMYAADLNGVYRSKWEEIKEVLSSPPSSAEIGGYLGSVGLDTDRFRSFYGEKKINDAIWFAKDLKDRYTVLWLYYNQFYGEKQDYDEYNQTDA